MNDLSENSSNDPQSLGEIIDAWPLCPQCRQPRLTLCPICQTSGADFPQAEYMAGAMPLETIQVKPRCDSGDCSCGPAEAPNASTQELTDEELGEEVSPPTLLICGQCDEVFTPVYYRYCESCQHDFGSGKVVDQVESIHFEDFNRRVILTLGGLGLLAAAGLIYFWVVLRG